jgi:hypothetical protein
MYDTNKNLHYENRLTTWAYRAGGRGGRQPPQFVGQTKPVGQYSLYSRAILAYYKKKWDKLCKFFGKFHIGKISMMFRKI